MEFYTIVLTIFFAHFIPITFVPFIMHGWGKSQKLVFLSEIKLAIIKKQHFDTLNGCSKMSHLDLDKKKAGEFQLFIRVEHH